jgi:hypothetical protein
VAKHTFRNRRGELTENPEAASDQAHADTLDALGTKFAGLLEHMQRPAAKKGMEAAFNTTPATLGQVAAEAARRRP